MEMKKMGKTKKILSFQLALLLIILVASQENMGVVVVISAQVDSCNVNPFPKCVARCLSPGECNKCCKGLGYPRGKCITLGCTCCN